MRSCVTIPVGRSEQRRIGRRLAAVCLVPSEALNADVVRPFGLVSPNNVFVAVLGFFVCVEVVVLTNQHAARHKAKNVINVRRTCGKQVRRIGHNKKLAERVANNVHGAVSKQAFAVGQVRTVQLVHGRTVHNPCGNLRRLVAELGLAVVKVVPSRQLVGGIGVRGRVVNNVGNLRQRRIDRTKTNVQHIRHRIDGELLPHCRACGSRRKQRRKPATAPNKPNQDRRSAYPPSYRRRVAAPLPRLRLPGSAESNGIGRGQGEQAAYRLRP
ncbi:hypothetical protein PSV3_00289 [Septimatrevirus PSV34]|uniref:Uncharacterized protein n=1 Tax=Pseudomonas phage PSV3 TaxID=3003632 RepID=A0AAE9VX72_9CAUD|nr:hypothetical protein PM407_gp10 [Pseudomonas phage PSV3]WBF76990.1 hypothetical protein PSV3_00289 [Pseudomonas phage PSV3]